jgi:hypothetical protein
MAPLVTPAIACSPEESIEATCASTDSERSKQSAAEAAITVSSRKERTFESSADLIRVDRPITMRRPWSR